MRSLHRNQRGLAAFIVVFMLMIVISMIVLGYTQIVRHNQSQSQDRDLSARAFYAAESGVNLATDYLKTHPDYTKSSCQPDGTISYSIDTGLDLTCLIIDTSVDSLKYSNVPNGGASQLIPINSSSAIGTITLNWQSTSPGGPFCGAGVSSLPPAGGGWACNAPLLRLDLVNVAGTFDMGSAPGRTYTAFFYPVSAGGVNTTAFSAAAASQGDIVRVACSAGGSPKECKININGLPGTGNYYARVSSFYADADLEVSALDGSGNPLKLTGVQALIDVTGRAVDVTRRIQVRKPIGVFPIVPSFAIQSGRDICKRYEIIPGQDATLPAGDGLINDPANACGAL